MVIPTSDAERALSQITQNNVYIVLEDLKAIAALPDFHPFKLDLFETEDSAHYYRGLRLREGNNYLVPNFFYRLLLVLLLRGTDVDSALLHELYLKLYPNVKPQNLTHFPEYKRRKKMISEIYSSLSLINLFEIANKENILSVRQQQACLLLQEEPGIAKKYILVQLYYALFKSNKLPDFTKEEIYLYQYLPDLLISERKAMLFLPQNSGIVEKLLKCAKKIKSRDPQSLLLAYLDNRGLIAEMQASRKIESVNHFFRRKQGPLLANVISFFLAIGSAAFAVSMTVASFGLGLAIPLGLAYLLLNYEIYRRVTRSFIREGIFTASFIKQNGEKALYTMNDGRYKIVLAVGYAFPGTTALALGVLVGFFIFASTISTFGLAPALTLSIAIGFATFTGNFCLFGDIFRSFFAYLERAGFINACKQFMNTLRTTFLSLEECREQGKLSLNLLAQKIFRVTAQSLFVMAGMAFAILASLMLVAPLKAGFANFIKYSAELGAKLAADIWVVTALLASQLALTMNTTIRLMSKIGKYLGQKIGELVGGFFSNIGAGVYEVQRRGAGAIKKGIEAGVEKASEPWQYFRGRLHRTKAFLKQHSFWEILQASAHFIYFKMLLPLCVGINAILTAKFTQDISSESLILTNEPPTHRTCVVASTVSSTALVLHYLPKADTSTGGIIALEEQKAVKKEAKGFMIDDLPTVTHNQEEYDSAESRFACFSDM